MSPKPSYSPQATNRPTAKKAASLTTDSNAIAATSPSWRSVVSMWRVPNSTANAISASAAYSVVSAHTGCSATRTSGETSG